MKVSIIIPVYNGEQTLSETLVSLAMQVTKHSLEVIVIDDCSTDNSPKIYKESKGPGGINISVVKNIKNIGLAASLNKGIETSKGNVVVILQQDIILEEKNALDYLIKALEESNAVAINPSFYLPKHLWKKYPFWQKVLFARLIEKRSCVFSNKFDAIKKSTLEEVGLFDDKNYRTAGECQDMKVRLEKMGDVNVCNLNVLHNHPISKTSSFKYFFHKESQLAEAYGTNMRRHGFRYAGMKDFLLLNFRPFVAIAVFIPYVNYFATPLGIIFSFMYSKEIFKVKDKRKYIVPFVNFINLYVYSYFYLRGFFLKKQVI